ncbi:hypothetical protein [Microbacterium soli]|uniref:Uncharacterized protein n=1 Tax=Microbacterium soli TaxID=446075 RepID=A0ABP7MQQ8_9MICO
MVETQNDAPRRAEATLNAVPSLQVLQTDAEAGLCADGYCVLPAAAQSGAHAQS